ncbi:MULTISPECIES: sugar ABC transporter permease [unclassified Paenibacillus]|uniref:carbohydrate ABC transporter permease n=1 Tax=unclassified Paenibacillus TaxID=185978 RepID=UPI000954F1E7|nr:MULTISPECIES: sugar ABC transporter permease [unclassified Paenibacillus]ASS69021.1 sugar ABC transporter permease [Paenibacillus sp. RUD330]SIR10195.1 multiple sugar transport system permease protein [Paenibacillus sp. RU4X]SIR26306.1 multiple sugar transport system permease protein [Paenibacillus sp. RU4T]
MTSKWREEAKFFLFILPWIVGFLVFFVGPAGMSMVYSFADYNSVTSPKWIGFDNYKNLLHDTIFLKSFGNTLYFVFIAVPVTVVFQILVSVILNVEVKGVRFFRTMYYLPYLVPPVATVIIWLLLFGIDSGFVNQLLGSVGLDKVDWLGSESLSKPLIVTIGIWSSGGPVLIFLAALKGVPGHLYEAAKIDGANGIRRFFTITLPMISPTILFSLVMQMIYYFQMFTESKLLNNGGPDYSSTTYMLNTYNTAFRDMKFGYAMAQSWILFLLILVLTWIVMKTSNRWVYYEVDKGKGT